MNIPTLSNNTPATHSGPEHILKTPTLQVLYTHTSTHDIRASTPSTHHIHTPIDSSPTLTLYTPGIHTLNTLYIHTNDTLYTPLHMPYTHLTHSLHTPCTHTLHTPFTHPTHTLQALTHTTHAPHTNTTNNSHTTYTPIQV